MSSIKRLFAIIITLLAFIMLAGNAMWFKSADTGDRLYRVEAARLLGELNDKDISEIDLSQYKTILFVEEYDSTKYCKPDYLVEELNGRLYRIAYDDGRDNSLIILFDFAISAIIIITIALYIYINRKILKPFNRMSDVTTSLAKGNLTVSIKQEKNKVYSRFLWSLDMLRDNLEENKAAELSLQKEKKTLILSLSHDIKTPLSAIDLYAKALEEEVYGTKEERNKALKSIRRNVGDIKEYVNQITKASREDFLNLSVNNGELYLHEMIDKIRIYYRDKLSVVHTEFVVEEYKDCLLKGDKDRLEEVLQNIMENAIKYGDGRKIAISFSDEEDCKLITVTNTGNTLREKELSSVFESFYRGSNAASIKGSGLGLYICKGLMRLMDGDIFAGCNSETFAVTVVVRKA